jgi:hypothetical protein
MAGQARRGGQLKSADRDLCTAIPVQILARNRGSDRMSGPFRGRPVEVRNGLPVGRFYVYRGLGYDQVSGKRPRIDTKIAPRKRGGVGSEQREQLQ